MVKPLREHGKYPCGGNILQQPEEPSDAQPPVDLGTGMDGGDRALGLVMAAAAAAALSIR